MPKLNPDIHSIDLLDLCDEALKGNLPLRQQINQAALKSSIEPERLLSHLKEALDNYRQALPKKMSKIHAKSLAWASEVQTTIELQQKLSLLLEQALIHDNANAQLEVTELAKEEKNAESIIARIVKKRHINLDHPGSAWLLECYLQQFPKCTQQVYAEFTDKLIDKAIFKDEVVRENLQDLALQLPIVAQTLSNRIHAIYFKSSVADCDRPLTLMSTDGQLWLLTLLQEKAIKTHFQEKELAGLEEVTEKLQREKLITLAQSEPGSPREHLSDTELTLLLQSPAPSESIRKKLYRDNAPSPDRLAARQLANTTSGRKLAFLGRPALSVDIILEPAPLQTFGISAR
ncbi:MAG: hypothetical protein K0S08_359 [Gammaproteobacteria bacterium]|nr:hypothetical protein [Gammaproteobacteria bacterium]